MNDLRERLTERGIPSRDANPPPVFPGPVITLRLWLGYPFDQAIPVIQRLREAGLTLSEAKRVTDALTDTGGAVCPIAEGAFVPALATDLAAMNVTVAKV